MPARLHPGVYTVEIPSGVRTIEGASTSTAIFIGETERGPLAPTRILGRGAYTTLYGGHVRDDAVTQTARCPLTYAIDGFFLNGGKDAYVLRAIDSTVPASIGTASRAVTGTIGAASVRIDASSPGIWGNRVDVAFLPSSDGDASRFRIVVMLDLPLGSAQRQIVESWDSLSTDPADDAYVFDTLKRSAYIRWPQTADGLPSPVVDRPAAGGLDSATPNLSDTQILALAAAAVAPGFSLQGGLGGNVELVSTGYPALLARLDEVTDASLFVMPEKSAAFYAQGFAYVTSRPQQDLFYIADLTRQANLATTAAVIALRTEYNALTKSDFAAVYWPYLKVADPVGVGRNPTRFVAPSGYVAGVYARTDSRRGVWKAPAGVEATVQGIDALDYEVLDGHQDILNPIGINALRVQPSSGPVSWGARTQRPTSEWRYVPVRRTAIFLRRSIYDGIQWAVFEPNDHPLWSGLRLTIGAFMEQLFRQGAFAGRTSDEAYFVKADEETTTEADQAAGVVNIWVGFAPLRPSEFVVVSLSQKTKSAS